MLLSFYIISLHKLLSKICAKPKKKLFKCEQNVQKRIFFYKNKGKKLYKHLSSTEQWFNMSSQKHTSSNLSVKVCKNFPFNINFLYKLLSQKILFTFKQNAQKNFEKLRK